MTITQISNNPYMQNTYMLKTDECAILIDCGAELADIEAALGDTKLTAILLTHYHYDHIRYVNDVVEKYGVDVYCHTLDADGLTRPEINLCANFGANYVTAANKMLTHGDAVFGLQVIHTPGHTPGSVCYHHADSDTIFTGDTLFKAGVGRTDLPQSVHDDLVNSIKTKLFALPKHTVIYPGHRGMSTIGQEEENF